MRGWLMLCGWILCILQGNLLAEDILGGAVPDKIKLASGVDVWLSEHALPPQFAALRVVCKGHQGVFTYKLDSYDIDVEEITRFFTDCKEKMGEDVHEMGVVAVGDFRKKELLDLICANFSSVNLKKEQGNKQMISLHPSREEEGEVSLGYSFPSPDIHTVDDLKKAWTLACLQEVVMKRLFSALKEGKVEEEENASFCLPQQVCKVRAHFLDEDPLEVLGGFLGAVQDMRGSGFKEEELRQVKEKFRENLLLMNRKAPDSEILVSYYVDLFAYGKGIPPYSFFVSHSLKLLSEISLKDIHDLLALSLRDENRLVGISLPPLKAVSEGDIKETLELFNANSVVLNLPIGEGEGIGGSVACSQEDSYFQLPLTLEDQRIIGYIIKTVGETWAPKLLGKKKELLDLQTKIDNVHPLCFLGTIFSNPDIKKWMPDVLSNYFKRDGFFNGNSGRPSLVQNLEREFKNDNLLPHINGFCATVHANPAQVRTFIQNKDWQGLVKYLVLLP